jgi:tetratricopeptide (TPR) repeat protein
MTAQAAQVDNRLVTLETQRGRFGELGRQLEQYAAAHAGQSFAGDALVQAAQSFYAEADIDSEMRVMQKALARNALSGELLDRYLQLLILRKPQELLAVVRSHPSAEVRSRAVQIAIGAEQRELAYSAIRIRGSALPPVWTKAYTALTGQYLADQSPAIDAAFRSALDTRTIGDRLKTPAKPESIIVGSVWFYYGARYGEFLADEHNPAAGEWLPASLEAAPENEAAYVALGDWYAAAGEGTKAIGEFHLALELDPDRADALDHIARVLWSAGQKQEAIVQWKSAMATFLRIQSRGIKVPEPFWSRAAERSPISGSAVRWVSCAATSRICSATIISATTSIVWMS